jgi:hypothetical protein
MSSRILHIIRANRWIAWFSVSNDKRRHRWKVPSRVRNVGYGTVVERVESSQKAIGILSDDFKSALDNLPTDDGFLPGQGAT